MAPSWRCPPVSTIASSISLPSTAACSFDDNPPRDRPTAWPSGSCGAAPLLVRIARTPFWLIGSEGVGGVLMSTRDGGIHGHCSIYFFRSIFAVAFPHRLPGTKRLTRQIAPRNPSSDSVNHAFDHFAILETGVLSVRYSTASTAPSEPIAHPSTADHGK